MTARSLYVHIPWCIRKCPYCDFNSYPAKSGCIPENDYLSALLKNLESAAAFHDTAPLDTIFFGGGTPSLFSPNAIRQIVNRAKELIGIADNAEITMEMNPGTITADSMSQYAETITRVSFGVQSFDDGCLKRLGRIHNSSQAAEAIKTAKHAGIEEINIDLMFGLPGQTPEQALTDVETAIMLGAKHISRYQLTIEEGTPLFDEQPELPTEDDMELIESSGAEALMAAGFVNYEVSAWSKPNHKCRHNLAYWNNLDYIGIGAGAHGRATDYAGRKILRYSEPELPNKFMSADCYPNGIRTVDRSELPFEYFLNAARIRGNKIYLKDFAEKTFLDPECITDRLNHAIKQNLITKRQDESYEVYIELTELGSRFMNTFIELFLPE